MTRSLRTTGRAFTLLELMLALALASIVAMSAFGLFEVMRRSERRQFVRMGEADEVARTYKAMERAFRTMVMSDAQMPGDEKVIQERLRSFERAVDNDDPDPPLERDEPEPRMILRPDPASPLLEVEVEGRRSRMKAQVMELALRSPPVLGARPDSRIFERGLLAGSRDRAAEARRVRDRGEGDEEPLDEEEPLIAPGVRGVFELVPDGVDPLGSLGPSSGLEGWRPRESSGQGWTLWWRELPPPPPESQTQTDAERDEAPRRSREEIESEQLLELAAARRVPLMTGLKWVRWEVYRGKRFDTRCRATWVEELPGFVKVAFETIEGRKENWMFEVGWTMGPEPGTEINRGAGRAPPGIDPRGGVPVRADRPTAVRGRNRPDGETPK